MKLIYSVLALALLTTEAAAISKKGIADDLKFTKDYPGSYYTERLAPKSDYIMPYAQPYLSPETSATWHESPRTYTMPTAESYKPMV